MLRQEFHIPDGKYSRKTFQEYIIENQDKLFTSGKKRKWIKVYGVRTKANEWQRILKPYFKRELGDLWEIKLPLLLKEQSPSFTNYYVCEYTPEILLFYTASTKEEYEQTLKKLTTFELGLGRMWIGPALFENLIFHFMDAYQPIVERFLAKRSGVDSFPQKTTREVRRRVDWSAEDSFKTLLELREIYGVRPFSVTIRLKKGKIQLTDEGMFVLNHENREMFDALEDALSFIKDEQVHMTQVAQRMGFVVETKDTGKGKLSIPQLTSGSIYLKKASIEDDSVDKIIRQNAVFDFVDSRTKEGSFTWVATAMDRNKHSVFAINSDERTINLVPRFDTPYETFLEFFKQIQEVIDPEATFEVFGGRVG